MNMKDRILFIAVGQGGGNITRSLEKLGYASLYINSSSDDLGTITTDYKNKYHLSGTEGCSKNISSGKVLLKTHGSGIVQFIESRYPSKDILFVVFTGGGGTGAGIGPGLMEALTDLYEDKNVGGIVAISSLDDTPKSIKNSASTWSRISLAKKSAALFLLDNNKNSLMKLNRDFAELLDKAINVTRQDVRGIIDKNEVFTLLTTPGVSVILKTFEDKKEGKIGLHNSVFVDYRRTRKTIAGISCKHNPQIVEEVVEDAVGYLEDRFIGYSDEEDLVILSGLSHNDDLLDEMFESVTLREKEMETEGTAIVKNPFASEENEDDNIGYVAVEKKSNKRRDRSDILKSYFN